MRVLRQERLQGLLLHQRQVRVQGLLLHQLRVQELLLHQLRVQGLLPAEAQPVPALAAA